MLTRGVELNDKDPGIHYQLFLAYSRLKRKVDADKEVAEFKRLDEVNQHGATPLMSTKDGEALPPLPVSAAGDKVKPPTPKDRTQHDRCKKAQNVPGKLFVRFVLFGRWF